MLFMDTQKRNKSTKKCVWALRRESQEVEMEEHTDSLLSLFSVYHKAFDMQHVK